MQKINELNILIHEKTNSLTALSGDIQRLGRYANELASTLQQCSDPEERKRMEDRLRKVNSEIASRELERKNVQEERRTLEAEKKLLESKQA